MGIHSLCLSLLLLFLLSAVSLCSADDGSTFHVVGTTLCADCNPKTSLPFSGLQVAIDCKLKNGEAKRVGSAEVDNQGKFKVSVPAEVVDDDGKKLKSCTAQLHSAAAVPCAAAATKIVLKSQSNGLTTFSPTKTLHFSSAICSSKSFWPPHPPLPPHPWFKHPPLPPHPWFHHPPPPVPVYKPKPKPPVVVKPLPPVPVYKPKPKPPVVVKPVPPVPVYKPKPKPPVKKPCPPIPKPKPPVKKPCPPIKPHPPVVVKPLPPPVPVYHPPVVVKPLPPPVPVYHPPVVVKPLPPPVPVYHPPVVVKPLPPPVPVYHPPVIPKKPCPPLPKLPPIPPKYFHHPKLGHHHPPLPPIIPHHP